MPIVQQHALCLPVHVSDGTGGYRAEPGVGKLGDDDTMCRGDVSEVPTYLLNTYYILRFWPRPHAYEWHTNAPHGEGSQITTIN